MKRTEFINLSIRVRDGYGLYTYFVGFCRRCRAFRIHTSLNYMSDLESTCEKGHHSSGDLDIHQFKSNKKRCMELISKLLERYIKK